jgi:glyoxylase-like metal-dependent hydrolase (beta-lactamase superfamily II)
MNQLQQISDHVYWMPPAKPDRPSLCAVVGSEYTLMLDAGSSDAHARQFLDALAARGLPRPQFVALTHWHWDHVFGAAELGVPVITHTGTASQLEALAAWDWSDAALDARVASGQQTAAGAEHIRQELPEPRAVRIAQASIAFEVVVKVNLGGGVTCRLEHVGGDHAADSSVMYVEPDRVLFLGDCLYDAVYAPKRHYTIDRLFPLLDTLKDFDAHLYVEGHGPEIMTRAQFDRLARAMSDIGILVDQHRDDEAAVLAAFEAKTGHPPDADAVEITRLFIAGLEFE